jgi:hypothetical protein
MKTIPLNQILLLILSQLPRLPHGFHLKFELIINGIWYWGYTLVFMLALKGLKINEIK